MSRIREHVRENTIKWYAAGVIATSLLVQLSCGDALHRLFWKS